MLAPDAAMLIGRYHLERPEHANEGVNTRLFRRIGGRWLITVNHVSAYEVAPTLPDRDDASKRHSVVGSD